LPFTIILVDYRKQAYEILALMCELMHERFKLLMSEKDCPPDLLEAVCTLIYCANRTECPELTEIANQLRFDPRFLLPSFPCPDVHALFFRLSWFLRPWLGHNSDQLWPWLFSAALAYGTGQRPGR
jgi:hypothetical protein